jgi:hypothetical protein
MPAPARRSAIASALSVAVSEVHDEVGSRHLRESDGCLVVDFGLGATAETAGIYRAFAARCIEHEVTRALVKPGEDDAGGEQGLRDAVTLMLLAGMAPGFRIALYSPEQSVEARYLATVRDLRLANVNAMWFTDEAEAVAWLTGVDHRGRRAA